MVQVSALRKDGESNEDLARRPRSFVHAAVTAAAALGRRLRRPRRRTSPPSWLVGAPQACRRSEVCRTASALTTTSSPPLLLAPQARWRQHAVLALPEGHWATARASTARSEVNYFASISGKLVELDAFGVPSSPRTRSAAHSAPILRTPLAGAAPSRRSVPKLVDEVRAHARREHAARAAARGASHAQEISNAWVAAGGARLLQARQFPRAVSASASVAHRTNEKISWRPCKCLYVLCLVCHMFCDVWLVIFWLCLDGFKRKNLNLDFARYSCRTQKAGGARPTGRYIDLIIN